MCVFVCFKLDAKYDKTFARHFNPKPIKKYNALVCSRSAPLQAMKRVITVIILLRLAYCATRLQL